MLVVAHPYHIPAAPAVAPSGGTVTLTNVPPHMVPIPIVIHQKYHNHQKRYNNEETEVLVQKALRDAWEQYGPKTKPRAQDVPLGTPWNGGPQIMQPPPINPNHFQPITSEWDQRVASVPARKRPVLQPGTFNKILSQYVSLEVNNHEAADFIRKVVFFLLASVIGVGWIFLGIAIGFVPVHVFGLGLGKRDLDERSEGKEFLDTATTTTKSDKSGVSGSSTSGFLVGNELVRELTERVFLALDGDWLEKLEQKVKKGNNGRWLKTHVHCCIMPSAKAKGTAECQLIRRGRKVSSPFKCISDLIYNIQFGPVAVDSKSSTNSTLATAKETSSIFLTTTPLPTPEKHFF